ncbi:uncharacterized protein ARMOST_20926 [Armillaria ostoyae]|uniref:Uncharacterized protein n=1 Tax=Armillaria ostoyae TaxID=47428 RepID=A0A284S8T6_ARMOS|nr:uncharacterized protein ARMOST_20926 [Armillaria ostoyae]
METLDDHLINADLASIALARTCAQDEECRNIDISVPQEELFEHCFGGELPLLMDSEEEEGNSAISKKRQKVNRSNYNTRSQTRANGKAQDLDALEDKVKSSVSLEDYHVPSRETTFTEVQYACP